MDDMIIRYAKESDVDVIVEIAASQWSKIYDGYAERLGDELYNLWFSDQLNKKRAVIRECASEFDRCLVCEIDGAVVGFATFAIENVDGNILGRLGNNAVSSDFRGRGIGGKLYTKIFEIMKENGCVGVKVTTGLDDKHGPARRAYEKMGFLKNLPSITYYKEL